jgi:hypothetical protein
MRGAALVPLVAVALATGCASGGPTDQATVASPSPAAGTATASFPAADGRSLWQLVARLPDGPQLVPGASALEVGRNRVAFVLVDRAKRQVSASAVALYTSRRDGTQLRGPYVARRERLDVDEEFRSGRSARDLVGAASFYVAEVPFRRRGPRLLTALARLDGRLVASASLHVEVGADGGPPDVGERAVAVHTETAEDVGGDLSRLSTREPPLPAMHEHDLADVLGRRPVALVFTTPQLCRTRVCGPVLDIAEQVRVRSGGDVAFIHQEIYVDDEASLDDDPSLAVRPQVTAWGLSSAPWAFVIDRSGKIVARFEGAFSARELTEAVQLATRTQGR